MIQEGTARTHRFELLLLQSFLRVDWPHPPCCSIAAATAPERKHRSRPSTRPAERAGCSRSTRPTALHAGRLLEADIAAHGTYYSAVLNAGIARDNAFPMSDEDRDTVLDTNLNGFYNVLRRIVIPLVSARRGGALSRFHRYPA